MKTNIIKQFTLYIGVLACTTAAHAQSGVKYPYVESNKIIVSKDANGGVLEEALLTSTELQELYNATRPIRGNYNKVSQRFQIAQNGSSSSFKVEQTDAFMNYCKNYSEADAPKGSWRHPTMRELELIWSLNDELSPRFYNSTTILYGSAVAFKFNYVIGVKNRNNSYYEIVEYDSFDSSKQFFYARCVRDL